MAEMFGQAYMQNALATATIVAVLAGLVGFFVALRGVSFAAHSLAQIGFAGAAGAVLIGADPLLGLALFAIGGGVGMGLLGARDRDVTTALILVASLGVGALFLTLNTSYATAAFSLLFGTIVGISRAQVWETLALAAACLVALAVLYRPLLLSSVSPDVAAARGVPVRLLNVLFLVVVGVAAAVTVPVAGTLLIFSLMVGPAAAAVRLARTPVTALLVSVALGLAATWLGIGLAYATGWPVGFFITAIVTVFYVVTRFMRPRYTTRSAPVIVVDSGTAGTA